MLSVSLPYYPTPVASVILAVYNQENFLDAAIESILSQTFKNFELLIFDDGSTDRSADIIKKFVEKDHRIKAVFEANSGRSNATNKLVSVAKGDWCVFVDADDIMFPGRIEKQLTFHNAHPEIAASSSHCRYIDEHGNTFGMQRYHGLSTIVEFKKTIAQQEFITCSYTGLMVRREIFIKLGGLTKKFELCDDFDFINRLVEQGYILLIIQEALMKYRIHAGAFTVKNPLFMREKIAYVMHCNRQRRAGNPEIDFASFLEIQKRRPFWIRIGERRFYYATIFFRGAGQAILSKRYFSFAWQIVASCLLSPVYVFKKIVNHSVH